MPIKHRWHLNQLVRSRRRDAQGWLSVSRHLLREIDELQWYRDCYKRSMDSQAQHITDIRAALGLLPSTPVPADVVVKDLMQELQKLRQQLQGLPS